MQSLIYLNHCSYSLKYNSFYHCHLLFIFVYLVMAYPKVQQTINLSVNTEIVPKEFYVTMEQHVIDSSVHNVGNTKQTLPCTM